MKLLRRHRTGLPAKVTRIKRPKDGRKHAVLAGGDRVHVRGIPKDDEVMLKPKEWKITVIPIPKKSVHPTDRIVKALKSGSIDRLLMLTTFLAHTHRDKMKAAATAAGVPWFEVGKEMAGVTRDVEPPPPPPSGLFDFPEVAPPEHKPFKTFKNLLNPLDRLPPAEVWERWRAPLLWGVKALTDFGWNRHWESVSLPGEEPWDTAFRVSDEGRVQFEAQRAAGEEPSTRAAAWAAVNMLLAAPGFSKGAPFLSKSGHIRYLAEDVQHMKRFWQFQAQGQDLFPFAISGDGAVAGVRSITEWIRAGRITARVPQEVADYAWDAFNNAPEIFSLNPQSTSTRFFQFETPALFWAEESKILEQLAGVIVARQESKMGLTLVWHEMDTLLSATERTFFPAKLQGLQAVPTEEVFDRLLDLFLDDESSDPGLVQAAITAVVLQSALDSRTSFIVERTPSKSPAKRKSSRRGKRRVKRHVLLHLSEDAKQAGKKVYRQGAVGGELLVERGSSPMPMTVEQWLESRGIAAKKHPRWCSRSHPALAGLPDSALPDGEYRKPNAVGDGYLYRIDVHVKAHERQVRLGPRGPRPKQGKGFTITQPVSEERRSEWFKGIIRRGKT